MVDRQKTKEAFAAYVKNYDSKDPKVDLKIRHTYKVAEISEDIARTIEGADSDIAWLVGMMHDIGRFEQLKRYNTFIDAESVDHAAFGCSLLFEQGLCVQMYDDRSLDELVKTAVGVHAMYRIPDSVPAEFLTYAKILRDADKIDIIRANMETPLTDIYNVSADILYNETVTKEVMENFYSYKATPRAIKKASVDHVVGHISLTFELEYPRSRRLMKEQGFLHQLMQFPSKNPETREQFAELRTFMERYLEENC